MILPAVLLIFMQQRSDVMGEGLPLTISGSATRDDSGACKVSSLKNMLQCYRCSGTFNRVWGYMCIFCMDLTISAIVSHILQFCMVMLNMDYATPIQHH